MSHNLNSPATTGFALPSMAILSLEGADAARFLHAQSMNDVNSLAAMDWHMDGWLNPQGRLVALFAVVKLSEERLLLMTPARGIEALAFGLQRFVFRSKVKITVFSDAAVTACREPLPPGTRVQTRADGVGVRWFGEARSLLLLWNAPRAPLDAAEADAWARQDLAAGIPWLGADSEPRWTPQQLSLERFPAFSVKKGCYPGQEIVARTHFLGKGKRHLHRVRLNSEPGACDDPVVVQRMGCDALCVLPNDSKDHPALVCGVDYSVRAFDPV